MTRAVLPRPGLSRRLALGRLARHDGRGIAAPGAGERRGEPKRRDWSGLWDASARDGGAQQQKGELRLHLRDLFLTALFLGSALGFAARTGLCLDLRGPSTSASTRSPSSGQIKPPRTA